MKTYAKEDVGPIAFAVITVSNHGATTKGLTFTVHENEVKVLSGLKAIEAQQVLGELHRLGYQVVTDPAMKMLIEMGR